MRKLLLILTCFLAQLPLLSGQRTNVVVVLLDDVGAAWFPMYAKDLKVADVEEYIVAEYQKTKGKGAAIDVQKHIDAAKMSMPFMDKMAANGVVFERCFATASLCAPSRAGFLTGSFQQRWGGFDNIDIDRHGIPEEFPLLAQYFKNAGYRTAAVGKWHLNEKDPGISEQIAEAFKAKKAAGENVKRSDLAAAFGQRSSVDPKYNPLKQGFDYYFGYNAPGDKFYESDTLWENYERVPKRPAGEFLTDLFNDKVNQFIDATLSAEKPFFVYYAPMTVHGPLAQSPEKYSNFFDTGIRFTDSYAGHLKAIDAGLEKIYETLRKHGADENTLFIFTSDNGQTAYQVPPYNAPYKGGKGTGWLGGLRVPLVIWGLPQLKGFKTDSIISAADVLPTALDIAGIEIPAHVDGLSFADYMTGTAKEAPRKELFSTGLQSARWSTGYELGKKQNDSSECPFYSWILKDDQLLTFVGTTPKGLYKKLPDGREPQQWMHNIAEDPAQTDNLFSSNPERVKEMAGTLNTWLGTLQAPKENDPRRYEELVEISAEY